MDDGFLLIGMVVLMVLDLIGLIALLIMVGWNMLGWYTC